VAGVPPPLVTECLVLRPLQPEDGAALWEQWNDPLVWRYIGAGVLPARERIERAAALLGQMYLERGWSGLLVSRRSDGRVLGECGLYPWRQDGRETGQVELGYRFGREHWGQGYAGEAARAVLDWASGELGFTELVCVVQEANTASRRIAERLGFRLQSTRHHTVSGVRAHDCWYEWQA
jgi:RimJ/RimL family protein N-acetyltransferase